MRRRGIDLPLVVVLATALAAACGGGEGEGCDETECREACVDVGQPAGACSGDTCVCVNGTDGDADGDGDVDGDGDSDGDGDVDGDTDTDTDTDTDADADTDTDTDADADAEGDGGSGSAGCGLPAGENDRLWSLTHEDRERSFLVHVPGGYDPAVPAAVVLNFHGLNSNAREQVMLSQMVALSDAEGFIAVHPNGIGGSWNTGYCCGEASRENVNDVGFTAAIIDRVASELCIDERRVYATGMSNGGSMSHRLGCELADRIAAIGPVAGANGLARCSPARAVPVFHFHGTRDFVVLYTFGSAAVSGWVSRNGCRAESSVFFSEGDVSCEEWTGCTDDATVRFCSVGGGGHQWPGSPVDIGLGHLTRVVSASQMMWDFFEGISMP